jgi:CHAT domain-containing protein
MNRQFLDAPVSNLDDDLLGMSPYADELANLIIKVSPPFTIGIYGEWGSGKSSFVRFLESSLCQISQESNERVKFINFTAWSYKTADELWRALILKIAQELYEVDIQPPAPVSKAPQDLSFLQWLKQIMMSDAFVLFSEPSEPDPLAEYEELIARLDSTLAGSISKSSNKQVQLNQEETILAFVKLTTAALSTLSPLVAGIRAIFGLDAQIDPAQLLQKGKSEIARNRIESTQESRQVLCELFQKKAKGQRICVFLDDLDRCTPDVALDLLEAIKIFLGEVPCIFIVAADEHLIGQGLRLRFKDLVADNNQEQAQSFLTQKGQEYFEKIIQMGIRVPERTPEQTHTFIAAQYPEWMAATDIIQVAIGSNPRRLKQYCNLLKYKYLVSRRSEPDLTTHNAELCNKFITAYSWNPSCIKLLRQLADHSDYKSAISELEACWQDSQDDVPVVNVEQRLQNDPLWIELYFLVVKSDPLLSLFKKQPFLAEVLPAEIISHVQFVDIVPNLDTILQTDDRVFMRIIDTLAKQGTVSIEKIIEDDLRQIILFTSESMSLNGHGIGSAGLKHMVEIARSGQWDTQIRLLEQIIERPNDNDLYSKLAAPTRAIFDRLNGRKVTIVVHPMLESPRFSEMSAQEIEAFWVIYKQLPNADELLSKGLTPNPSAFEKACRLAVAALDLISSNAPELYKEIKQSLEIHVQAAYHFLDIRKFAKVDALSHHWTELARLLLSDRSKLIALEEFFINAQADETVGRLVERYRQDEQLAQFFQLCPFFRDIFPDEVKQYLKFSQSVVQSTPELSVLVPQEQLEGLYQSSQEVVSPDLTEVDYLDLVIKIDKVLESEENIYEVRLLEQGNELESEKISLDNQKVDEMLEMLNDKVAKSEDLGRIIRTCGLTLFDWLFTGQVRERFQQLLQEGISQRIIWDVDESLLNLPLEVLYVPYAVRKHLALTSKYSVVRRISNVLPSNSSHTSQVVRILAVFANPKDTTPINIIEEERLLQKSLQDAIQNKRVQLEIIGASGLIGIASRKNIQERIQTFQPHLFHFVGHGSYQDGKGHIILENDAREGCLVTADDLSVMLSDSQIKVAIMNGCDTGLSSNNDAITGISGALINQGIPAVISTMRAVPDRAALLFTRKFYTAFANGYDLERSLVETRKALSIDGFDWSTYALFTGNVDLNDLKFSLLKQRQN